ncbi:immunity protein YezG family protein [Bacillus subtilis]
MGQLYQQIAEQLNEMIPSEWTKIVLYAEIFEIYQKFIFL